MTDGMRGMKALLLASAGYTTASTPAGKLATAMTLKLPLPHLLAKHPRFAQAYKSMSKIERDGLAAAWGGDHPGLKEMIGLCWSQELFDWEEILKGVPSDESDEESSVWGGTIPCVRQTNTEETVTCLSYSGDAPSYSVWSDLITSELSSNDTSETRALWVVKILDLARYVSDDRNRRDSKIHNSIQSNSPLKRMSLMPVTVLGEPAVGEKLRVQSITPESENLCTWQISPNGWDFTFVKTSNSYTPKAGDVHHYLQAHCEVNGNIIKSKMVLVNISDETNEALCNLVCRCVKDESPAEFEVQIDGVQGVVLMSLDGVVLLVTNTDKMIAEGLLKDVAWSVVAPRTILASFPKHVPITLEVSSKTSRDGLLLTSRLFTSFPISLLGSCQFLPEGQISSLIDGLLPDTPLLPGALPTLLYKVEHYNGVLSV
eukprot:TRINITY_DN17757_c0_g1_i1.p1 TRINITY_DN17757_c0_g1~~TRINITY_DN17757_c0_g1_i1.p1  ORF type:complete len:430 (+),score=40.34 TRINITY_DN17757_c0_g1_i1:143-1432(+)